MKKSTITAILSLSILVLAGVAQARLPEKDIAKKKEGYYVTGLPLPNFTTDDGFGMGARVYLYNNGNRSDKDFVEVPYNMQLYGQGYATTGGWQYHELNLDMFNVFGTRFRMITYVGYDRRSFDTFFGYGSETTKNNLSDRYGRTYDTFTEYTEDFLKKEDATTGELDNYLYNKYEYIKPTFALNFFGDLTEDVKFLTGIEVKKVTINSYGGEKFEYSESLLGDSDKYTSEPTLLDRAKPVGYNGGWSNFVRLGVAYDTRDYEPDPKNGVYVDYAFEVSHAFMGSDFDYIKNTVGARYYVSPMESLVLALRLGYTTSTADETPFFEGGYFGYLFDRQRGLGGYRTMRGFKANRFIADTMTNANIEARFQFAEITPFGQRFEFKVLALFDTGNAYDKPGEPFSDPRFGDYRFNYGGGFVIAWNMATIIHVYAGISPEDFGLSINFKHSI